MDRNDLLWRRLFLSSNNDSFDINTLWTSYVTQGENSSDKKHKFLRDIVDFWGPTVRNLIEGDPHQVLSGCTNKKVYKLNRHAVKFMGSQIDIVDHIRSFVYEAMLLDIFVRY